MARGGGSRGRIVRGFGRPKNSRRQITGQFETLISSLKPGDRRNVFQFHLFFGTGKRSVCPRVNSGNGAHTFFHIGAEAIDQGEHITRDGERRVFGERGQVHGEVERAFLVGAVGGVIGGVRQAAAGGGQIVALAAADLRIENAHQGGGDVGTGAHGEHLLVFVEQPIEVAPYSDA